MVTGDQLLAAARGVLGDPYVYGAAGPSAFDCSGLVQWAAKQIGITAPRTSQAQWSWSKHIQQSDLAPGDLIFEQWPGDATSPGHVVIYAGSGQVIEAPKPGGHVQIRAWSPGETTIIGYGRLPGTTAGTASSSGGVIGSLFQLALPSQVLDAFSEAEKAAHALMWLLNPESWVRIVSGAFGFLLACAGLVMLIGAT